MCSFVRRHRLNSRNKIREHAVRHLVGKLFRGSSELLFAHLVSDQKLTKTQIRRLRQLLKDSSSEGSS